MLANSLKISILTVGHCDDVHRADSWVVANGYSEWSFSESEIASDSLIAFERLEIFVAAGSGYEMSNVAVDF